MTYEHMVVTVRLGSPIAGDPSVPLDGPLLAVAMREAYGAVHVTIPGALDPRYPLVDLPLARHGEGEAWYYACTWAIWPALVADSTQHWVSSFEADPLCTQYLSPQTARVPLSGGRYRSYRMPLYLRHAEAVAWHVAGDRDWLARTLPHIRGLGKKTSQGYGQVLSWDIAPLGTAWSARDAEGQPLRALPRVEGRLQGVRPPYWLPAHQWPCEMPRYPLTPRRLATVTGVAASHTQDPWPAHL